MSVYTSRSTRSQNEISFKATPMTILEITTLLCCICFWNILHRPARQLSRKKYFPWKHEVLSSIPRTHIRVAEMEVIYWLGNAAFHYCWLSNLLTADTNTEPLIQHHPPCSLSNLETSWLHSTTLIGGDIILSLLKYILILFSPLFSYTI